MPSHLKGAKKVSLMKILYVWKYVLEAQRSVTTSIRIGSHKRCTSQETMLREEFHGGSNFSFFTRFTLKKSFLSQFNVTAVVEDVSENMRRFLRAPSRVVLLKIKSCGIFGDFFLLIFQWTIFFSALDANLWLFASPHIISFHTLFKCCCYF